jgi:hypothetical protein
VTRDFNMPVITIATLDDMLALLQERPELKQNISQLAEYREVYGAIAHA